MFSVLVLVGCGFLFASTSTHTHFVYRLLKARPEITFASLSSKGIWVDKPEHGLEGNEMLGFTPTSLSNMTLYLSDWKSVYEIKSMLILLFHKSDIWGLD